MKKSFGMKYDWHCCEIYLQHRTILCFNRLVCLTCVFVQNGEQRSHHHPVHPSAAVLHLPAVRQPHAAGGRKTGVSRPDSGHPGLLQSDRYENTHTHTHTHVQTDPHVLILIYVCVCQDTSVNLITTLLISSWMSLMENPPPSLSTS